MTTSPPALSVVIPVYNERDNAAPLVHEVCSALRDVIAFEIVCVDDGSNDGTDATLHALKGDVPELRVLRHAANAGQSSAIRNGVKAALGAWIATLDGDGQNDPADIPKLLAQRATAPEHVKMFAGWRVDRKDSSSKRWASKIANAVRMRLLRDATPDTGCGTKLFEREAFLELPFFDHMHRFLPALMQRAGWSTISVPVCHRPRTHGLSKYNNMQRAFVGLADLRGVAWLIRRGPRVAADEL
jgi:dolichol-phosphate mannosyltransferase